MDLRVLGIVQKSQAGFAKCRSVKRSERLGFVQVIFTEVIDLQGCINQVRKVSQPSGMLWRNSFVLDRK